MDAREYVVTIEYRFWNESADAFRLYEEEYSSLVEAQADIVNHAEAEIYPTSTILRYKNGDVRKLRIDWQASLSISIGN